MVDRTKNRSDSYQWVLIESACSPEMLAEFADSESISSKLNPFGYNEEFFDLQDRLKAAFWRIVNTQLTKRQREVIVLYTQGFTQIEIAKKLNVNQCFKENTNILLANGNQKHISKIEVNEFVLGKNDNGNIVPSKVLNKWNNGLSKNWCNVILSNNEIITCTVNHKFYSIEFNKYIPISEFKIGSKLYCYGNSEVVIISIEILDDKSEFVKWDIETETHNFFANNVLVSNSSITKSLNGNCDYRSGRKIYGGAKKKLKKISDADPEIQEILKRMIEIQGDVY